MAAVVQGSAVSEGKICYYYSAIRMFSTCEGGNFGSRYEDARTTDILLQRIPDQKGAYCARAVAVARPRVARTHGRLDVRNL